MCALFEGSSHGKDAIRHAVLLLNIKLSSSWWCLPALSFHLHYTRTKFAIMLHSTHGGDISLFGNCSSLEFAIELTSDQSKTALQRVWKVSEAKNIHKNILIVLPSMRDPTPHEKASQSIQLPVYPSNFHSFVVHEEHASFASHLQTLGAERVLPQHYCLNSKWPWATTLILIHI